MKRSDGRRRSSATEGIRMPSTESAQRAYLPAAGRDWLLPLYDPFTRLLGVGALHGALLEQAALVPGHRVLDVGCGTGTLLELLERIEPGAVATGLDPDANALARARRKVRAAVTLDCGYADALPYSSATFDRVFSTLMLHHLEADAQSPALREMHRVLKPDGALLVLDFAARERDDGAIARLFHRDAALAANYGGGLARRIGDAGFVDVTELGHGRTLFGSVVWYRARPRN
jgi:ubiquinone/menaquinone biosynthesis C-methylase UbiE